MAVSSLREIRSTIIIFLTVALISGACWSCGGGGGGGSANVSQASQTFVETSPSPPTGISVQAKSGQSVINWNSVTGAQWYYLYWSTTPVFSEATAIWGVAPPYTFSGISGTNYYFWVTARNSAGESNPSVGVTASLSNMISISTVPGHPLMGDLAENPLGLSVSVSSTYEIRRVKARVENVTTSLAFNGTVWTGSLSLPDPTRGEKLVTITVVDALGNSAAISGTIVYDQKAGIVVSEPIDHTVARPQLHVVASCIDDDPAGCKSISVAEVIGGWDYRTILTANGSSIDQFISLSSHEGESVTLRFQATDSAGQTTSITRTVYVESSDRLREVSSVNGKIWDVKDDRILYFDTSGGKNILGIHSNLSSQDTIVMDDSGKVPQEGFLTPRGAIFVAMTSGGDVLDEWLYEWRDGVLFALGVNIPFGLKVTGNYAIWNQNALDPLNPYNGRVLILRDLVSGVNTTVSTDAGSHDVTADGEVVYSSAYPNYQIFRYRGAVTAQLTGDGLVNTGPLTDGINVVYGKANSKIAMNDGTAETILATFTRPIDPAPSDIDTFITKVNSFSDYQINNGWIAFTKEGIDGARQVWTRSPAGVLTQITFWGTSSALDFSYLAPIPTQALGPNGEVIIFHRENFYQYNLYWGKPGTIPVWIGSRLGRTFYQNGQWHVIIGRSVFAVVLPP